MNNDLAWMLNDALNIPEARHAILLSSDGILRAHSEGISRDEADRQAAALAGLQSISRSTAEFTGNSDALWRQSLVEFTDGFIFLVAAGPGAYLAVSATENVDMELITFRMQQLVRQLGKELSTPPRQDAEGVL